MKGWGRAKFQLVCMDCRRIVEKGERILYLGTGDGINCAACGDGKTAHMEAEPSNIGEAA